MHRLYLNQAIEVLVVDDSRTSRHRTAAQLRKQLLQVHEANSARDALAQLEQHPAIRLMLVDYYMPEIDGISLVRNAARALQQAAARHHRHLGIGQTRPLGTLPLKQGANDFLNQPFEPEELQCRVSHNLEALEQFNNIQESANRDYLTGLYNRRYWFNEGQSGSRSISAIRRSSPCACSMWITSSRSMITGARHRRSAALSSGQAAHPVLPGCHDSPIRW